jgi:hypothetical protein
MHPGTENPNKPEITLDYRVDGQIVLNEHP